MKVVFKSLCRTFLVLFVTLSYGQELPEVIPPSPTVANLMQFEEVPISYYTGQPNISIPLYSKAINGDLGINIGLSYNTQGVKINNRSGWTGTGWSLSAGGSISRTVRGLPDEWPKNSGGITGEGVFHNDDFWDYETLHDSLKQKFLWRAGGTPSDKYDHESDLFQFNALGMSGRFVIVKQGTTLVPKLLSKNQNIKIDIDYNSTTFALNKFTVTDTKGYVYTFDITEEMHSEPFIATEYMDGTTSVSGSGQDYVSVNAWHLSKIELPNLVGQSNKELVTFTYQDSYENYTASVSRTESRVYNPPSNYTNLIQVPYNASVTQPRMVHSYYTSNGTTKKLDKITFRDGTYIEFDLKGNGFEHPETEGDALEYVRIKDASHNENKHYKLNYDTNTTSTTRLWLESIDEVAGSITNSYTLEYNDKYALPAFDSVSATDDWGYYTSSSGSTCGVIIPDTTAFEKGLLNKVIYPTGGSKEFEFERHRITYQGNTQLTDDEYRDKNPDNWDAYDKHQTYFNSFPTANPNAASFTLTQAQEVSYQRISASGTDVSNTVVELRGPNSFVYTIPLDGTTEAKFTLDAGTYEIHYVTLVTGTADVTAEVCVGYKRFKLDVKRYVYGGGVRIKSIKFKDNPLDTTPQKEILFDYAEDAVLNKSSGSIDGSLTGLVRTHIESVTRHMIAEECAFGAINSGPVTFQFVVTSTGANVELTHGQYVGYKTVKAYETGNGYNQYTYTSSQDFYSNPNVFSHPYTPADDIDYKRGLLLEEATYNESGDKLKETINTYSYHEDIIAPSYRLYSQDCEWKMFYDTYAQWTTAGTSSNVHYMEVCNGGLGGCSLDCLAGDYEKCGSNAPYYFLSNDVKATWARLETTNTKEFFYEGATTMTKEFDKVYTYNTTNFQIADETTTYKEKGVNEQYVTEYYYPIDASVTSTSSTIKTKMINLNKVNEVLETITSKNGTQISQTNTVYGEFATDQVLPEKAQTKKGTDITEDRIEFKRYDSYNNPIEVLKTNGTPISYVWGFDSSVPVAKVVNAYYSDIEALSGFGTGFNLSGNLSTAQDDALRSLSTSTNCVMVDTYTYDPLIGVLSGKDARDYETSYVYDDLNRLQSVKDQDGYLLNKNEYVYGAQSYVKTIAFQVETTDGTTHAITGASLQDDDKIESIAYVDGLGRALQSITKQGGGNFQDIIVPVEYDDYGRQPIEYLPYANATQSIGSANLNFRTVSTLMTDLEDYYVNKYPEDQITSTTINAYSKKSFETSPLNRVLEQGAPGKDWQLDTGVNTDHTIKFEYSSNTFNDSNPTDPSKDNIIRYDVSFSGGNTANPSLVHDGNFKQGELYKTITKDENWQPGQTYAKDHTVEEYKDAQGRVLVKRTFDAGVAHDTYYVYDDFGNLTYVLSPESNPSASSAPSAAKLDGLCYQYKYDHRNRLIEKKIPGKGWEYIVYDKLDRPVLTQDPHLNTSSSWLFTKYDDFDRVVYTGIWSSSSNRSTLQTTVDGQSTLNETRSSTSITIDGKTVYYTNAAYPNSGSIELHTINYYDDYNWDTLNGFEASYVLTNVSACLEQNGNAVTKKTSGCNSAWDTGFTTDATIAGDGYIQWTVTQTDKRVMVGLSRTNSAPDDSYTTIDYALYTTNTSLLAIYEEGVSQPIPNIYYQVGDVFKVERIGNQIVYKRNDVIFYTSATSSSGILLGDSSFFHKGTTIEDVHIGYSGLGQAFTQNTKGLATGSKVRTLKHTDWTHNETRYDDKARPTRIDSKNEYLQTLDALISLLDFNGKVIETHTSHLNEAVGKKAVPIVTVDKFTYDHTGRLLRQTQCVNDQTEQLFCKNTYDEVGLLSKKQVGGILADASTYTNLSTGITTSGSDVTKSTGTDGWNAGASTVETIAGDGYVRFTIPQTNKSFMVGLNYTDTSAGVSDLDYAIYVVYNGLIRVYESGIYIGDKATFAPGDTFSIERRGSVVYYLKNGQPFYRSAVLSNGSPMIGDTTLFHVGVTIEDLVLVNLEDGLQDVDYTYNIRGWLKEINDITSLSGDLFAYKLNYNTTEMGSSNAKLYNGNISETLWYTINDKNGGGNIRGYAYSYDALNRIKEADYGIDSGSSYNFSSGYDLWDVGYDKNGNISGLKRRGENNLVMDELTYGYTTDTNKLLYVDDTASSTISTEGFDDTANSGTSSDYNYDSNGNMILDKNKNITNLAYNHLNLPTQVTFHNNDPATTGAGTIDYVYDATGVKLSKFVKQANLSSGATTYYAGNFVYEQGSGLSPIVLKFFSQPEGYVEPDGSGKYDYVYQFKDHLGNIRLAYGDFNKDNSIDNNTEIIEEHNYYPFGLKHKGYNDVVSADVNSQATKYRYNGIELEESFGLDLYEMDVRQYDPAIARWTGIDPVVHHSLSTYNAFDNNPVYYADPSGADSEYGIDHEAHRNKYMNGGEGAFQGAVNLESNSKVENENNDNTTEECNDCSNNIQETDCNWLCQLLKRLLTSPSTATSEEEINEYQEARQLVSDVKETAKKNLIEKTSVNAEWNNRFSLGMQGAGEIEGLFELKGGAYALILGEFNLNYSWDFVNGFQNNSNLYYFGMNDERRFIHRGGAGIIVSGSYERIDVYNNNNVYQNQQTTLSGGTFLYKTQQVYSDNGLQRMRGGFGTGISMGAFFVFDSNGGVYLNVND